MNHNDYYTRKEAMSVIGISSTTLDKIIRREEISVLNIGIGKLPRVLLLKKEVDIFDFLEYKKRVRKKRVSKNKISS